MKTSFHYPDTHSTPGGDSPGSSVFDLPTQPARTRTANTTPQADISNENDDREDAKHPSFLVISGGTGCNSICPAFGNACYVLPVSDDGGSSSEIIRVLGGPSIGESSEYY